MNIWAHAIDIPIPMINASLGSSVTQKLPSFLNILAIGISVLYICLYPFWYCLAFSQTFLLPPCLSNHVWGKLHFQMLYFQLCETFFCHFNRFSSIADTLFFFFFVPSVVPSRKEVKPGFKTCSSTPTRYLRFLQTGILCKESLSLEYFLSMRNVGILAPNMQVSRFMIRNS